MESAMLFQSVINNQLQLVFENQPYRAKLLTALYLTILLAKRFISTNVII